jgi:hypothetical protein
MGLEKEKAIVSRLRRTGRTNAWSADGTHLAFFDEEEISTQETCPMDGIEQAKSRNDCIIEKEFLGGLTAYLGCGLLGLWSDCSRKRKKNEEKSEQSIGFENEPFRLLVTRLNHARLPMFSTCATTLTSNVDLINVFRDRRTCSITGLAFSFSVASSWSHLELDV